MLGGFCKVEQRYDAVWAVIRDEMEVNEVAGKFAVHRDTVQMWLARYEAGSLAGSAGSFAAAETSSLQMPP